MRFSLLTLLLIVLWLATAMLVWSRREPWVLDGQSITQKECERRMGAPLILNESGGLPYKAPDGRMALYVDNTTLYIVEKEIGIIGIVPSTQFMSQCLGFVGNDFILFADDFEPGQPTDNPHFNLYKRRHPEWRWGHFCRPEVWALIVLSLTLLVHFTRTFLKRRRSPA
jgi:hypothetical protein